MRHAAKLAAVCAVALISTAALVAPADAGEGKKQEPSPEVMKLGDANNKFGFDIFKKLHKDGDNTFISPTSIAMAMQMAAEGAKGDTRAEMIETLHADGIDLPEANKAYMAELAKRKGVTLKIANSLWGDPTRVDIKQQYIDDMSDYFASEVRAVNFSDPDTLKLINGWISDRTNKLIPKMLVSIPPNIVSYLINAIYFKGDWTVPFDKRRTRDADFHLVDGTTKPVTLMARGDDFDYAKVDGHQVVRLPYGEKQQTAMWVVLPDEKTGLDALVKELDNKMFARMTREVEERNGTVKLPRFEVRFREQLNKTLKELGVVKAFAQDEADFSDFASSSMGNVYINSVLHEAVVIVNEEGTEAAAATIIADGAESEPPPPFSMTCDRPFLFVIHDKATNSVLFAGTCYDPDTPK